MLVTCKLVVHASSFRRFSLSVYLQAASDKWQVAWDTIQVTSLQVTRRRVSLGVLREALLAARVDRGELGRGVVNDPLRSGRVPGQPRQLGERRHR